MWSLPLVASVVATLLQTEGERGISTYCAHTPPATGIKAAVGISRSWAQEFSHCSLTVLERTSTWPKTDQDDQERQTCTAMPKGQSRSVYHLAGEWNKEHLHAHMSSGQNRHSSACDDQAVAEFDIYCNMTSGALSKEELERIGRTS